MRQDQSFPAHFELLLCDKPVRLWRLISENETKRSNFEQNVSTKSQKAAGIRIGRGSSQKVGHGELLDFPSFQCKETPQIPETSFSLLTQRENGRLNERNPLFL